MITHGHAGPAGRDRTPEYYSWTEMKRRCSNPKATGFEHYGGRGISVCERWRGSFQAFLADMGPRPDGHTLDRIDVNGNYEPGNCRWADWYDQSRNKRYRPKRYQPAGDMLHLRLPAKIRSVLESAAARNERTLSGEVRYLLSQALAELGDAAA